MRRDLLFLPGEEYIASTIRVKDAFRLGRPTKSENNDAQPRPMKCSNIRLLKDLSPEDKQRLKAALIELRTRRELGQQKLFIQDKSSKEEGTDSILDSLSDNADHRSYNHTNNGTYGDGNYKFKQPTLLMNVRSLLGKRDELEVKLSRAHPLVATVTESWPKKTSGWQWNILLRLSDIKSR